MVQRVKKNDFEIRYLKETVHGNEAVFSVLSSSTGKKRMLSRIEKKYRIKNSIAKQNTASESLNIDPLSDEEIRHA